MVIAVVGAILILIGLGMVGLPALLEMIIPWFPHFGDWSIPVALIMVVFGLTLLVYGKKLAGIA